MAIKKHSIRKSKTGTRTALGKWKTNKTVLVTGASGGIGYDLSSIFAENGYNIVLIARNKEKLLALANQAQQMFGVSARVLVKDLTRPNAAEEIYRDLEREGIIVDILVNNAGYGLLGNFAFTSKKDELEMIQLNISAVAHMTKLFLQPMIKRGRGRILNVASAAGFLPGPLMANYSATKAYVVSFSAGLAEEVRENGVTVSVLCPGPTFTGFQDRAGIRENSFVKLVMADSRVVARAGYEGLMAGKLVIIPGFFNKLGSLIARISPFSLTARSLRRFREPKMLPIVRKLP